MLIVKGTAGGLRTRRKTEDRSQVPPSASCSLPTVLNPAGFHTAIHTVMARKKNATEKFLFDRTLQYGIKARIESSTEFRFALICEESFVINGC